MKNLLFVSIAFPPKSDPECLQTAKYYYYLQKFKSLNIEVLTSASPTLFMPVDNNLKRYDTGYTSKVELVIPENKYLNYILRSFFRDGIDWPDSKKAFHRQWKKVTSKITQKPDIIYSRSFPLSSAVMGLRMQEYYKVPWIMHLSDPWFLSPIDDYSKRQFEYHKNLERNCVEKASYICLTSQLTIDMYRKQYPEFSHKFLYYPNVFDIQDFVDNPFEFNKKIKVVYTGGLVGARNILPLLAGLRILKQKAPEYLSLFDFVFAGVMDNQSSTILSQQEFDNINHVGILHYQDALKLQRTADILLVIDNPIADPEKAVFFPSKLLDYLMMQRKIMAITTLGGTTDNVLKTVNGISLSHDNPEKISNTLIEIADAFKRKETGFFKLDSLVPEYSAEFNAQRLLELINSL
jgi:hypothetical protein